MKYILIACGFFLLSGCDEIREEKDRKPQEIKAKMPLALKDCRTFRVPTEHNMHLIITRCPNSVTTTDYGKNNHTTVVDEEPEEDEQ